MPRAISFFLSFALWTSVAYGQANGNLQIHFIDVGQGDGALLISPQGRTVLLDTGVVRRCAKPVSYVLGLGVSQIDYHIATHYHADHIGCTPDILRQLPLIGDALDRGGRYDSDTFDDYVAAVGTHRRTAQRGMKIVLDDETASPVEIEIVALNGNGVYTNNENDLSVVSVIRFGNFHAVIGGDISGFNTGDYEDIETGVSALVGQVEVYKVHHHCSSYSSNATWLAQTKPMVGIVSAGDGNPYGHPTAECLDRLHAANVRTYWTERGEGAPADPERDVIAGDIVVQSPPGGLAFSVTYGGGTVEEYTSWETVGSGAPSVAAVVNGASFLPGMSAAAWVSIWGQNLAPTSRQWRGDEIVNGRLPTQLEGVSVTIDGRPAAVSYISPTQLNVQVPTDNAIGPVQVEVTTRQGSASMVADLNPFAPGFFTFGGTFVAAQHADYSYVARPGLLQGVVSSPAQPGEVVLLYATGFGPTAPAIPAGEIVTVAAPLANPVVVRIGGVDADVQWAGVSGAGLWQLNVKIPDGVPDGDATVLAEVGGVQSQPNVLITIRRP